MKIFAAVIITLALSACTTVQRPHSTLNVINSGVRMPSNEACSIVGNELRPCP